MTQIVEDLMIEYAELVGAPFPLDWEDTAYQDEPEKAKNWELEHPAYVNAWAWLQENSQLDYVE